MVGSTITDAVVGARARVVAVFAAPLVVEHHLLAPQVVVAPVRVRVVRVVRVRVRVRVVRVRVVRVRVRV